MSHRLDRKTQEDKLSPAFSFLLWVKREGKTGSATRGCSASSSELGPAGPWGRFPAQTSQLHRGEATHAAGRALCPFPPWMPSLAEPICREHLFLN